MASRPPTKKDASGRAVLGNDPFRRATAPRPDAAPAESTTPPPAPAAAAEASPLQPVEAPLPKAQVAGSPEPVAMPEPRPASASTARPGTRPARPTRIRKAAAQAEAEPQPTPVVLPKPVVVEQAPAEALVKAVLVPEVEDDLEEPAVEMPRPPAPERPSRLAPLAALARKPLGLLAEKVSGSPRALDALSMGLSAATAVQSLARGRPGPTDVDDFGEDRALVERTGPTLDFLYRHWFRVTVEGADELPSGPLLAVANHAGALPIDGPLLRTALERSRPGKQARWLVEDALFHAPFMGTWLNRLGAVRACPENATRLLEDGAAVVVFPEGLHGLEKTWRQRYEIQRFGRGGFVKLALRTGAPLVPTAVVGVEESSPVLATVPAGPLGFPFLPITPTFPLLGLAGLVPLPAKWTIAFGKPIDLSAHGPDAARDLGLVQRITEEVRSQVHELVSRHRLARRSVFSG